MFNLSLSMLASVKWLTGQDNWQLWAFVTAISTLLLCGILIAIFKRSDFASFAKISSLVFLVFALGILITNLVMTIRENEIVEYQKYFIICGILLVVTALFALIRPLLAKDKPTLNNIFKVAIIALLIATIGMFIAGMVSVKDLGWIDGDEIFVKMGEGGQIAITVCSLIVFLAMAVYSAIPNKKIKTNETLALVYGGISIAMSFALSYARIFKLPAGGSITVASLLPLALYAYMFGAKKGVMAGMIYGVLQIMQDPWIVHPAQVLLDYVLAFGMIGFTGLFRFIKNKAVGFTTGVIVASILRYLCHVVSGGLFFYAYANQVYSPWAWTFLYNSFVFADIAIVVAMGIVLMCSKQFVKLVTDIRGRYIVSTDIKSK